MHIIDYLDVDSGSVFRSDHIFEPFENEWWCDTGILFNEPFFLFSKIIIDCDSSERVLLLVLEIHFDEGILR